ncbi:hypothetical protein [Kribbella sp. NPDC048915]|uniref:hypothetical protein n=1 Tax=Kribbella sp. NPDC048915 TaxID=3155148 RepID=UPI0033C7F00E
MITEYEEIARYRVEDRLREAERRALRHNGKPRVSARTRFASTLHRLADRLEPASRKLTEPAARQLTTPRGTHRPAKLSVVR